MFSHATRVRTESKLTKLPSRSGFKFSQLEMSKSRYFRIIRSIHTCGPESIEVVMTVLLEAFEFSIPDTGKEVVWNLAGVRYPTIGKDSKFAEFPMRVTPINT